VRKYREIPVLNLLTTPWLPVIRRQTGACVIRPVQIIEDYADNPVIAIDWPRPDFRVATLEFLIGLLATAAPPYDDDDWLRGWLTPPTPDQLDEAFAPLQHAFALDGNGPRFLQDFADLQAGAEPIERLLIEAPGEATTGKNTDLLVHRGQVLALGRASAAIALYTFQSWAPAGGAGNRTGLRGGGPLVTLVLPGDTPTLWHTIWANVPRGEVPDEDDHPKIFPWLAPTITSEGSRTVTPENNAHRLQCWWGMPRRIRLDFAPADAGWACDLTGAADEIRVTGWRQRPRGANYAVWGGIHPLSPHYRQKPTTELLPVHPQPGGVGYRHWLGLVFATRDGLRFPAASVNAWSERILDINPGQLRMLAAGYDMDNMKARGFVEADMPLHVARDAAGRKRLEDHAYRLITAAHQTAELLRTALRQALFAPGATVKADAEVLNSAREFLWDNTERRFFDLLGQAAEQPEADAHRARQEWHHVLRRYALSYFDEIAPLLPDADPKTAARIGKARRNLGFALAGYGAGGNALFTTLSLATPETKAAKRGRKVA